ncbi:MAG: molybdopterin-dependent oxidoreductase, partial [Roseococcus sp.]|nr:molybdopterin-dependent oxidoreductase [Roseococcus sp.]
MNHIRTSRRSLMQAAGALVVGFHVAPRGALAQATPATPEINAWVVIHPDDRVVLRMARAEMGQGTRTGLCQMIAEELHCDWSKISTEYVTPGQSLARNRAWGNFLTAGSLGVRQSQDYVRRGGATARIMLVQAAAARWGVEPATCTAKDSVITHTPTGRTL